MTKWSVGKAFQAVNEGINSQVFIKYQWKNSNYLKGKGLKKSCGFREGREKAFSISKCRKAWREGNNQWFWTLRSGKPMEDGVLLMCINYTLNHSIRK